MEVRVLRKSKADLRTKSVPPKIYDPIIREMLESTIRSGVKEKTEKALKVQYCGKATEDYARALHKAGAPCNIVMTLRKL